MSSSKFVQSVVGKSDRKVIVKDKYLAQNEVERESVARVLLTGIVKNQFYRKAEDTVAEAIPLLIKSAKTDPLYLLKATALARNSHMKGMVKVAIAALASHAGG